jgi:hypothetical protein
MYDIQPPPAPMPGLNAHRAFTLVAKHVSGVALGLFTTVATPQIRGPVVDIHRLQAHRPEPCELPEPVLPPFVLPHILWILIGHAQTTFPSYA